LRTQSDRRKGHAAAEKSLAATEKRGDRPASRQGESSSLAFPAPSTMRSGCTHMSGNAKLILSSEPTADEIEAIRKFEPAELSEPVDLADVSRLIGDAKDPKAGARLYSDALRETALYLLAYREHGRDALELSGQVVSPLFDELTGAFADSYRERGCLLLWALLKAASIIGEPGVPIEPEIEETVIPQNRRTRALDDEERRAVVRVAVSRVMKLGKAKKTKGEKYARIIRPEVLAELRRIGFPGQEKVRFVDYPSLSTIKEVVAELEGASGRRR
jgi:hypothetical protein